MCRGEEEIPIETPHYHVDPTSSTSAEVEYQGIGLLNDDSNHRTRRVARFRIVRRSREDESLLEIELAHQRRHNLNENWEDERNFSLQHVTAGHEVRIQLHSEETANFLRHLSNLDIIRTHNQIFNAPGDYAIVNLNENVILNGHEREIIQNLISRHGVEFWNWIEEFSDQLPVTTAQNRINQIRNQALDEFRNHLRLGDWAEPSWQEFFENNHWVFGYGLSYQFLQNISNQPITRGRDVTRQGEQRGDFLLSTTANIKFTALVEIKTPSTELLESREYRNGVFRISPELNGGVIQLQQQCHNWVVEESRTDQNRDLLHNQDIYSIQPRLILIIGNSSTLNTNDKRKCFEIFRRNIKNIEIITYDELFERARFIVRDMES